LAIVFHFRLFGYAMKYRGYTIHRNPKGDTITFVAVIRGKYVEKTRLKHLMDAIDDATTTNKAAQPA